MLDCSKSSKIMFFLAVWGRGGTTRATSLSGKWGRLTKFLSGYPSVIFSVYLYPYICTRLSLYLTIYLSFFLFAVSCKYMHTNKCIVYSMLACECVSVCEWLHLSNQYFIALWFCGMRVKSKYYTEFSYIGLQSLKACNPGYECKYDGHSSLQDKKNLFAFKYFAWHPGKLSEFLSGEHCLCKNISFLQASSVKRLSN